jgi:hypothetical protein
LATVTAVVAAAIAAAAAVVAIAGSMLMDWGIGRLLFK